MQIKLFLCEACTKQAGLAVPDTPSPYASSCEACLSRRFNQVRPVMAEIEPPDLASATVDSTSDCGWGKSANVGFVTSHLVTKLTIGDLTAQVIIASLRYERSSRADRDGYALWPTGGEKVPGALEELKKRVGE